MESVARGQLAESTAGMHAASLLLFRELRAILTACSSHTPKRNCNKTLLRRRTLLGISRRSQKELGSGPFGASVHNKPTWSRSVPMRLVSFVTLGGFRPNLAKLFFSEGASRAVFRRSRQITSQMVSSTVQFFGPPGGPQNGRRDGVAQSTKKFLTRISLKSPSSHPADIS